MTAGVGEGLLLGHCTYDSSDEIHSTLDVDIDHLGEQIEVEKGGELPVLFQINLEPPIINNHA